MQIFEEIVGQGVRQISTIKLQAEELQLISRATPYM
jgi:hypothetical protein